MVSILQALGSFKKWYKCEGVSVGGQQVRTQMKWEGCGHSEVMLPDRAKAIWLARAMDWIGFFYPYLIELNKSFGWALQFLQSWV